MWVNSANTVPKRAIAQRTGVIVATKFIPLANIGNGGATMKKLIVKWRDSHCNITITHIQRVGDVVEAYRGKEFVGLFDLGSVDALYVSEGGGNNA